MPYGFVNHFSRLAPERRVPTVVRLSGGVTKFGRSSALFKILLDLFQVILSYTLMMD